MTDLNEINSKKKQRTQLEILKAGSQTLEYVDHVDQNVIEAQHTLNTQINKRSNLAFTSIQHQIQAKLRRDYMEDE